MPVDLSAFVGQPPYASELLGVYQPILGWKGRQSANRVQREAQVITSALVRQMLRDSRFSRAVAAKAGPYGPDVDPLPNRLPDALRSGTAARVQDAALKFMRKVGRPLTLDEWAELAEKADVKAETQAVQPNALAHGQPRLEARHTLSARIQPIVRSPLVNESVIAGTIRYLGKNFPHLLNGLFLHRPAIAGWDRVMHFADPLETFDPESQQAVLSPIGVLQLYRQYFFELDSFLGPAVGHVWLPPGSSLEIYEVHSRKRLEERQIEQLLDVTVRSEESSTDQDELSTAVSEQNGRNTNLAVSATAGVNFGVVSASSSTSFGLQQTHQASQQEAHRHTRQQSEKLSNDIRKSFKTSFRTSVESQDLSSRKYVLANTTGALVNYEMRRKMRRIAVQLQHIGTQLCWQVYLDQPGDQLGVSTLVHATASGDLSGGLQPPEAPPTLLPQETEMAVDFPWPGFAYGDPDDETYNAEILADLFSADTPLFAANDDGRLIRADRRVVGVPPQEGYELVDVREIQADRAVADQDQPWADAIFPINDVPTKDTFTIRLRAVNFNCQPAIKFTLKLVWHPSQEQRDKVAQDFNSKVQDYEQQKSAAAHQEYVNAVRDRIKAARSVQTRPSDDLREEERTVVYRGIIGQLTGIANQGRTDVHVVGELVRTLFDVDKMLYFVAPEWWLPRNRDSQQRVLPPTDPFDTTVANAQFVGPNDTAGWGQDLGDATRKNYQVTEDSDPAPLGASLGWVLQLDGDAHRNAFLNTPWVRAVLPIRPGLEIAALNWLQRAHVEGVDGLDADYVGPEGKTVGEALRHLASTLETENRSDTTIQASDKVFETGFDPLDGGFRNAERYQPFDQWIEILPTDQIVAVEYPTP